MRAQNVQSFYTRSQGEGREMGRKFFLFWVLWSLAANTHAVPTARSTVSSCPIDLRYVGTIPWDYTTCTHIHINNNNNTDCCQTLLSLYGVGLSQHLKSTSQFRLPDFSTSAACLSDLQSILTSSFSLPSNIISSCFPSPARFVITPDSCAGIETKEEWIKKLGNRTALDDSCKEDLSGSLCDACLYAGLQVQSQLTKLDGNTSHATDCFYFTVIYAAGVANDPGPANLDTASCVFGLPILIPHVEASSSHKSHRVIVIVASTVAAAAVVLLPILLGLHIWLLRHKRNNRSLLQVSREQSMRCLHERPNTGSIWYTVKELEKATSNFSTKNLIGRGGFGAVYKGLLSDGSMVAVKKITQSEFEGDEEFRNEMSIISNLRHRNLVPLRGCCIGKRRVDEEDGSGTVRYLVYDYMPNGNLEDHISSLSSNKKPLTWPQRKSIILDVAKGIEYLHCGVKPAIFHRDIKATNILLDAEMRARIADFGLARQSREGLSHLTTRIAGTYGYLAPEYALYGQLTDKSDVYSFGILILEIMSGRKAMETSPSDMILITDWAWTLVKTGRADEVLDVSLMRMNAKNAQESDKPKDVMNRFVMVGILCSHVMVALRPTIADALKMLEGDIDIPSIPDGSLALSHGSFSNDACNCSISTASSGPLLESGDMFRERATKISWSS